MNTLEKRALRDSIDSLYKAIKNLYEKEVGRQEHLRPFTEGAVERAIEILEAIEENDKQKGGR